MGTKTAQMISFVAIACMIVACEVLWMGHTMLVITSCRQMSNETVAFSPPSRKQSVMTTNSEFDPEVIDSLSRAFPSWDLNKNPYPCVHPGNETTKWGSSAVLRSPAKEGLLFVRNMKTASSTLVGVAIRMAQSLARKTALGTDKCKLRFDHTPAVLLKYSERHRKKSFLWSFVRDPTDRAVSEFFHFGVSRLKMEPSDANMRKYLTLRSHTQNYFVMDMSLRPYRPRKEGNTNIAARVKAIMNDYDFIGVVERMDESLVALKMMLQLDMNDILYLSAKRNGGFDEGAYKQKCFYIVPSFVTPGMKRFFASPAWQNRTLGDRLLVEAANRSLDLTIDALGRKEFERQLSEYRRAQAYAQQVCGPSTTYPCSSGGQRMKKNHTCLWWDSGCGHECLDRLRTDEYPGVALS